MARKAIAGITVGFDKASYNAGDVATLTVTRPQGQLSVTVNAPGLLAGTGNVPYALPLTVTANDGHAYVQVSDDGTTAKYTTTV